MVTRKPSGQSPRSQDSAYKRLFSHKDLVADLIRGYVSPDLAKRFNLDSLERCNGNYISQDLRGRENDLVWRLKVQKTWVYVYLLLEFQSTVDRWMAVRLLGYIALLWQDLIAAKEITAEGTLPPVLPIVLYNGDRPWNAPIHLRDLIASPIDALAKFQPDLQYLFLDENHVPVEEGMELKNLAAAVFALEQCASPEAQLQVVAALREWLKRRPDLQELLGTWAEEVLRPTGLIPPGKTAKITLAKVESMMATRILANIKEREAKSRAEGQALGKAEGEAKGKAEGMIAAICRLVETGILSLDVARAQVKALLKEHQISGKLAKDALGKLG